MRVKHRTTSTKARDHHKATVKDSSTAEEPPTVLLAAEASSKKWQNWWIRTITTLIMIAAFFLVLASGYVWSIVMVLIITVLVYKEVISIAYYSAKGNLSWFKTMSW
jgi:phosphatidate cytidylyltransferase